MRHQIHRAPWLVAALLAVSACGPGLVPLEKEALIDANARAAALRAGSLTGTALAPVIAAGAANVISAGGGNVINAGGANIIAAGGGNVIAAGGGSIIAAGGGNVISAGGANYRTLAVDELAELPVAHAQVLVRDARTLRVLSFVRPIKTDEQGRFTVPNMPAGINYYVEIVGAGADGKTFRLGGFGRARARNEKGALALSQTSTFLSAHLIQEAHDKDRAGKIYVLDNAKLEALASNVASRLGKLSPEKRKAAGALLGLVRKAPAESEVRMPEAYEFSAFAEAGGQLKTLVGEEAGLQARVGELGKDLSTAPTDAEQRLINQATRVGGAVSVVVKDDQISLPEPAPTPSVAATAAPTATPASTATAAATPAPTPTPTPAPAATQAPNPASPLITSYSPLAGRVGSRVTILGSNFSPDLSGNLVQFGSGVGRVIEVSTTRLVVEVPSDAQTGPLAVSVYNPSTQRNMSYSKGNFTVQR